MPMREAHNRLLEHLPALRKHLMPKIPQRLRREIDVDDVLQDVLKYVLKLHGPSAFSGINNMRAYLKTAASSVLLDKIREFETIKRGGRNGNIQILHQHDQTSLVNLFDLVSDKRRTPSSEAAMREAETSIQLALTRIPEDQRTAVQLCHIDGLSHGEAARKMGRSAASVHGLLDRGLAGLRSELKSAARFLSDAPTDA